MIYTVTFNPALDYTMKFSQINLGKVNRAVEEEIFFGGKGINVSRVLKELEFDSIALGFVAGFTGETLERELEKIGIKTDFVHLKQGLSRINVKIKSETETDLNGMGPKIEPSEINQLFEKLSKLKQHDILIIAGSVPETLPKDIYEQILALLDEKDIKFIVDATGKLLLNVLKYNPFLIKPNNIELGEIVGDKIKSDDYEAIEHYAKQLQTMGARNVLVSLAANGAFLLDEDGKSHKIGVANGKVINSVGAGDSMVAGFIAGYLQTKDYDFALMLGSACGSATAFSKDLGKREEIEKLLNIFITEE